MILNSAVFTMITIKRTNSGNSDFQFLVKELDLDLKIRDGDDHAFYAQFNKTATLQYVLVAYEENEPVGSGALRELEPEIMEIKRMYVIPSKRGRAIASKILLELENWCRELGIKKCKLETGKNQPEAIRLYEKNKYLPIPNYGPYQQADNSVCFEKVLNANNLHYTGS